MFSKVLYNTTSLPLLLYPPTFLHLLWGDGEKRGDKKGRKRERERNIFKVPLAYGKCFGVGKMCWYPSC